MKTGKSCSQASHAAIGSFLDADEKRKAEYHRDSIGTKICLKVADLNALLEWRDWAKHLGVPNFLVEDTGRNSSFKGMPTVSALGIGPLYMSETRPLRHLKLL